MSTKTIVKRKADDFKAGMDWFEIRRFSDDVSATILGADSPSVKVTPVRCTVNMRGGIKELSVEVTTDD